DNSVSNQSAPNFDQYFELDELKAQSQKKDTVITKLKERIKSLSGNVNEDKTYKQLYDSIKPTRVRSKEQCDALINQVNQKSMEISYLNANLQEKAHTIVPEILKFDMEPLATGLLNNRTAHSDYLRLTREQDAILKEVVEQGKSQNPLNNSLDPAYLNLLRKLHREKFRNQLARCLLKLDTLGDLLVVQIVLWYLDSGCSKHTTGDRSQLTNFVNKFFGNVKFGNDHVEKIMGYGDYQIGNVTISRVYYVEGLGHNLFAVGQFCDSNLEIALRQHTCFIRNLEGKSKKKPHKPKSKDTNQEKLYLLHMDLYGPMRVSSVNEKKYIFVIVDDYSRFTCLEPTLHKMIPATISSGLLPNPLPLTSYVPPSRTDWDILFQPMFDELLNPPPSVDLPSSEVIALIAEVVAPEPVTSTGSPSSTTVDQDAPSPSNFKLHLKLNLHVVNQAAEVIAPIDEVIPQVAHDSTGSPSSTEVDQDAPSSSKSLTPTEIQSPVIPQDVGNDNLDIEVAHMGNDPLPSVPITEVASGQSSSTASPQTNVHPNHPRHIRTANGQKIIH
nr:integrase, catalytic region, zinc finger, CCHC-type, peptidase aspartic, catalytic [Tanacetum cinerariifolium]